MTFRGVSTAGDGATASSSSLTVSLPGAAVAGDAAVLVAGSNYNGTTLSTPAGWTLLSGPDDATAGNRGYMFGKVLTAGDISAGSVTLTYSATARAVAVCAVFDVGGEAAPFGTPVHTSTTTTASSVTTTRASSDVALFHLQGFAGPGQAPACTLPQGNDASARGNLASGANMGLTVGHIPTTVTGSYGGGAITGASIATNYTSQVWGIELLRSVGNTAPSLTLTSNQNVAAAAPVSITATAADSDGTIASYAWTGTRYSATANPATITPTSGAGTATIGYTSGGAGTLDVWTCTVTDDDGATAAKSTEVRVPASGELLPLRGFPGVGATVSNVGGAASIGAALSDSSDSTYAEYPLGTGSEQAYRFRLAPSQPRSAVSAAARLAQDTAGTLAAKVRLQQGTSPDGSTVALVKEWSIPTLTTSFADYPLTASSGDLATVTDWGNLWLTIAEI